MSSIVGYQTVECRPSGVYRHMTLRVFSMHRFDIAASLEARIRHGRSIAGLEALIKAADGRPVYVADNEVEIGYQADPSTVEWYAPELSLYSPCALRDKVYRTFSGARRDPKNVVESLKAIRVETLHDKNAELVYAGGSIAYVQVNEPDARLDDPYPVKPEFPAADSSAAA